MESIMTRLLINFQQWKNLEDIDSKYDFDDDLIAEKYFESDYFKEEFSEQEQELLTRNANLKM